MAASITQRKFHLKHNIAEITHDRIDPTTLLPNRGDRSLSFFVPRTTSRCINFSYIQLHLKVRLVSGMEGHPLQPDNTYIVPGFVPSTIFSNIVVRINDTEVTNASQLPLLTKFLFLTQLEPARRKMLEQVNHFSSWDEENVSFRFIEEEDKTEEAQRKIAEDAAKKAKDDAAKKAAEEAAKKAGGGAVAGARFKRAATIKKTLWTLSNGRFPESQARSARFQQDGGRGTVTYSTFLMTELSGGGGNPLILPPCDLSIEFFPADASRAILTDMPYPDTRVEIVSAHLTVPRILPRGGSIPRSLHWNFLRTRITPLVIPQDRMEFHAVILHSGLIGRRISLMFLEPGSWEGSYRNSIYRSFHNFVENIEVRAGSRVLPSSRIRANFETKENNEMYLYTLDSLKWSLQKTEGLDMINKRSWEQGSFIWSADTTVDQTADSGFKSTNETGSVNLSISFTRKTSDQIILVVFTESNAAIKIESSGSVSVSD